MQGDAKGTSEGACCGLMPMDALLWAEHDARCWGYSTEVYIWATATQLGQVRRARGVGERRNREGTLAGVSGSLPGGGDSWRINLPHADVSRQMEQQLVGVRGNGSYMQLSKADVQRGRSEGWQRGSRRQVGPDHKGPWAHLPPGEV